MAFGPNYILTFLLFLKSSDLLNNTLQAASQNVKNKTKKLRAPMECTKKMKKEIEKRLYQRCALPFTREDVCPWNGEIGAFNTIAINAQNVLVLTG